MIGDATLAHGGGRDTAKGWETRSRDVRVGGSQ